MSNRLFWYAWIVALAIWLSFALSLLSAESPVIVLCEGVIQQTSDLSDFYYCGKGLTLSGPPEGVAVMQLRHLAGTGKRYRIVAVLEAPRELRTIVR